MRAMPRLDGSRVLVTGGTSGIGRACVERLVSDGARAAFTGRDVERGDATASATGAIFLPADGRDEDAVRASVAAAADALGGLDGLVCAAGVALDAPLTTTSLEDWRTVIDVNLTAPYLYSVACLPLLRAAGGGSIVHVSSDAGVWGDARVGAYSVSKAALNTLAQMLAIEAGPDGVTVNALCLGGVEHVMASTADGRDERRSDPKTWLVPPVGRFQTLEEIAGIVVFLLGPEARYVNGTAMLVDGGIRAGYRAWSIQG
jgi:NAD(P)-dependent dehydrogenase (short-subunit alcohol dehydrogenase family)